MAVKSSVITVNTNDPEGSINDVLTTLSINTADFLTVVILSQEDKNRTAKIAIFYNEP